MSNPNPNIDSDITSSTSTNRSNALNTVSVEAGGMLHSNVSSNLTASHPNQNQSLSIQQQQYASSTNKQTISGMVTTLHPSIVPSPIRTNEMQIQASLRVTCNEQKLQASHGQQTIQKSTGIGGLSMPTSPFVSISKAGVNSTTYAGSKYWEVLKNRLLPSSPPGGNPTTGISPDTGINYSDSIATAIELKNRVIPDILRSMRINGSNEEYGSFLSAFIPTFSTILTTPSISYTTPTPNALSSVAAVEKQHELKNTILEIIRALPMNETLRVHAPHLVAISMNVLLSNTNLNMVHGNADALSNLPPSQLATPLRLSSNTVAVKDYYQCCEENAVQAAHIISDLYKVYRTLSSDHVQRFLDYVISLYRSLPFAIQYFFTHQSLSLVVIPNKPIPTIGPSSIHSSTNPAIIYPTSADTTGYTIPPTNATLGPPSISIQEESSEQNSLPAMLAQTPPTTSTMPVASPSAMSIDGRSEYSTSVKASGVQISSAFQQGAQHDLRIKLPSPSTPLSLSVSNSTLPTPPLSVMTPTSSTNAAASPHNQSLFRSKVDSYFRVLTECPLIVMLIFQLYPRFAKTNIPIFLRVMIESLGLRIPSIHSIIPGVAPTAETPRAPATPSSVSTPAGSRNENSPNMTNTLNKQESAMKRLYNARVRELISAQAKTLSFLTYRLRSFGNELKQYEEKLALNVIALMSVCPRESISTRRELLVATRHLLNNPDFRKGFYKHIDTMLDSRVLMGSSSHYHYHHQYYSYRFSDQAMLRPFGYTTLSELIQHVRPLLNLNQVSRIVGIFSRALHDSGTSMTPLPLSTQYTAVRTMTSLLDIIYNNNDANGQLGRDLLCRIFDSLVDKLKVLNEFYDTVVECQLRREEASVVLATEDLDLEHEKDVDMNVMTRKVAFQNNRAKFNASLILLSLCTSPDTVRDITNMIRAIIFGSKSIINHLYSYKNQREIRARQQDQASAPGNNIAGDRGPILMQHQQGRDQLPPGSNEEVFTVMQKLTTTEASIIDRYILSAIPAIKLLKHPSALGQVSSDSASIALIQKYHMGVVRNDAATPLSLKDLTYNSTTEKIHSEYHREALTHFASSFSSLDAYNLRRTLGKRIEFLIDTVVDDPTAMIIPRHLLTSNRSTSFEFCNILLEYLVENLHLLSKPSPLCSVKFANEENDEYASMTRFEVDQINDSSRKGYRFQEEGPIDSEERQSQRSLTLLHLFERVLKSISTHPDNEAPLRRHLRRMVTSSFRFTMENTDGWPDNYCSLLRYIFRSISTGKLEDSYKELLPLLPTILNSLYRILSSIDDVPKNRTIRHTVIELCLTIPARLSSLLPHLNLMLRIIIPALNSTSGDLIDLGIRTLELWVDSLHPSFLFPEISKDAQLFTNLMQSLTRHLRPAPYTYGLLTLRLLGKMGGHSRLFLRNASVPGKSLLKSTKTAIECRWRQPVMGEFTQIGDMPGDFKVSLPLPLQSCLRILKLVAQFNRSQNVSSNDPNSDSDAESVLWNCQILSIDLKEYNERSIRNVIRSQLQACLAIIEVFSSKICDHDRNSDVLGIFFKCLFYTCIIDDIKEKGTKLLESVLNNSEIYSVCESFRDFVSEFSQSTLIEGSSVIEVLHHHFNAKSNTENFANQMMAVLCCACRSSAWCNQAGLHACVIFLLDRFGRRWATRFEIQLLNIAFISLKSSPKELSLVRMKSMRFFIQVCHRLYGKISTGLKTAEPMYDSLTFITKFGDSDLSESTGLDTVADPDFLPSETAFRIVINELTSSQHLIRFAARFWLQNCFPRDTKHKLELFTSNLSLVRRVIFSRSLRVLPLPQQVGVVEGLAIIIKDQSSLLPLSDQHLVVFLQELLKMLSVADGEMNDPPMKDRAVNKDGFITTMDSDHAFGNSIGVHSSSIFVQRECLLEVDNKKFVVNQEFRAGVQLRKSTIALMRAIVLSYRDQFFEADWIGNIRQHVISLLFRSLVSAPFGAVKEAHQTLQEVLDLWVAPSRPDDNSKPLSKIPKELVQTCIRPVLSNLKDYTRLSFPLLRGLSRLLSLLSSWFNKTLGEKLLDHLQMWTDPGRILSQKRWKEGDEPMIASAIVSIFPSLPHAAHFVEPLVKTCIKLEANLHAYRPRMTESPFRLPLARYLAKHPTETVTFFIHRMKTPLYSEIFQSVLLFDVSEPLRRYLGGKQGSASILNICFERPLAILKAEKNAGPMGQFKNSLFLHGIGALPSNFADIKHSIPVPMNVEALELQLQGFRLVMTLLTFRSNYFKDHEYIIRAFRLLWRSKGRLLRLQHEDVIAPRYHGESKMLVHFLVSFAKSNVNEDLDILFELIRVFLQPSTLEFSFVSSFLTEMITSILSSDQKQKLIQRFFVLVAGDNEEIKVLSLQFLIYPMIAFVSRGIEGKLGSKMPLPLSNAVDNTVTESLQQDLVNSSIVETFMKSVIFQNGNSINCGDRLKVELLRLLDLIVDCHKDLVKPFRGDAVRYCWNLLMSDDTSCKCWSYIVACRLAAAFDTPNIAVMNLYTSLVRMHQQEGKELVQLALDIIIPTLSRQLNEEELIQIVNRTCHLMTEDSSSTSQVSHICHTVVRGFVAFERFHSKVVPALIQSLSRLSFGANTVLEYRTLAVNIVEMVLMFSKGEKKELATNNLNSIINFLVRLRVSIAESVVNKVSTSLLDCRVNMLLTLSLTMCKDPSIQLDHIENALSKDQKNSAVLVACLQCITAITAVESFDYVTTSNPIALVISKALDLGSEDPVLQKELLNTLDRWKCFDPKIWNIGYHIEALVEKAQLEVEKLSSSSRSDDERREQKDKALGNTNSLSNTIFISELLSGSLSLTTSVVKTMTTTLISLAKALSKYHLQETKSRQRQGVSGGSSSSSGVRHHTPIVGIFETVFNSDDHDMAKSGASRKLQKDANSLTSPVKCLIAVLSAFETCDVLSHFSICRKTILQLLLDILDGSDCVHLILTTTRIVGKFVLTKSSGYPVTLKERNGLLGKLATFDTFNISDDVAAQPVQDLVAIIVVKCFQQEMKDSSDEMSTLCTSCLLSSNQHSKMRIMKYYLSLIPGACDESSLTDLSNVFWYLVHTSYEGVGSRFWTTIMVDVILHFLANDSFDSLEALRSVAQLDALYCQSLLEILLPEAWKLLKDDGLRLRVASGFETCLSRPSYSQFSLTRYGVLIDVDRSCNSVRSLLNAIVLMQPLPLLDIHMLVVLADNYRCWYEVLFILDLQCRSLSHGDSREAILSSTRHCFHQLQEEDSWISVAQESCRLGKSTRATSLHVYGMIDSAIAEYTELMELVESNTIETEPTDFELDLWEDRWVELQREISQSDVVTEFANSSGNSLLQLDCAWKSKDWSKVRNLFSTPSLLSAIELGNPAVKMCDIILSIADGKFAEVVNLHAQTAQLCLYKWQLLPSISIGSLCHESLLHFFHRLLEIRDAGQAMAGFGGHIKAKALPDLKDLLTTWRNRLPNESDRLTRWDDVFIWRSHVFDFVTSNFHWAEPDSLSSLHDKQWTSIRLAKTARKHGMRDVSLLTLSRTIDERSMSVSDAFNKLREQILWYNNPQSELERHGGLNLINSTNLSYFDSSQKSELFRLKASFLFSIGGRSKANQAYCNSVQICPTNARAWDSWGELCSALGLMAEKQHEQTDADNKEAKASTAKRVAQYYAQAMGCYFAAVRIDTHEWTRLHLGKCLWMLTKDGSSPGVLCQTFESRGEKLPAWVWLPWLSTLLTCLYRREGKAVKSVLIGVVKCYPQAIYYALRAFYLERRDVERSQNVPATNSQQNKGSVLFAEELMASWRRSHASLWSTLEPFLEELTVKFKPSYEEELLSTVISLLERVETQVSAMGKKEMEEAVVHSVWKALLRIGTKFFGATHKDSKSLKFSAFRDNYKISFESDFCVSSNEQEQSGPSSDISLDEILLKLRKWKYRLESDVLLAPKNLSLIDTSQSLSMFGIGDTPDLWPGACDPTVFISRYSEKELTPDTDPSTSASTALSSVFSARKAANSAAMSVVAGAVREGVGGDYGGGSSLLDLPGQFAPNSCSLSDVKPSPELHLKVMRFDSNIEVFRRNDQLVRRIGIIASDGRTYHFLLQFAVPYLTRTEERTCQMAYFLDKVFRKDIRSSRRHLSFQVQPVLPVAQRIRLIGEVRTRISLEDISRHYSKDKRDDDSTNTSQWFNDEVKRKLTAKTGTPTSAEETLKLEKCVRLEVFNECQGIDGDQFMISRYIYSLLNSHELFHQFRRTFAQQWGVNCLLQYIVSTTERTPGRVVFCESSGQVLSPEFRTSYGSQGYMEKALVPFRLTNNLHALMGPMLLEGRFIPVIGIAASAIHSYKDDLEAIWRLLMRDDLVSFYTRAMAKTDQKTVEMERQLMERIYRNVVTIHNRLVECTPTIQTNSKNDPVDIRVRELVTTARANDNLCMMAGSYQAWL